MPWYSAIDVGLFVDGYFSLNFNEPKPQGGTNRFRAFDDSNGFALSWIGLNASYAPSPVGAAVNLRFGPSAAVLAGDDANHGLEFVKQAYATWQPGGDGSPFIVDFGKFDTIYGAEVADSQANFNYTRGVLYTLGQPFFHTGLRARYAFTDQVALRGMVVNGWNNTIDNNAGKSAGVQLSITSEPEPDATPFGVHLGYLVGPEQPDTFEVDCDPGTTFIPGRNACETGTAGLPTYPIARSESNWRGLRHLIDLVVTVEPTEGLSLVANGDYAIEQVAVDTPFERTYSSQSWYGAMLAARYQATDIWALAGRFEYYGDPDARTCNLISGQTGGVCQDLQTDSLSIVTGTLTVEAVPADPLILRLEGRWDHASDPVFPVIRTASEDQATVTLGVVATTE